MPDQRRDVALMFPERGQHHGENVQAVLQVRPESASLNFEGEMAVGGCDDSGVGLRSLIAAERAVLALVKRP